MLRHLVKIFGQDTWLRWLVNSFGQDTWSRHLVKTLGQDTSQEKLSWHLVKMGSYWDVWSRHIFSCVSSYYKGKYILCVIYRRVVAANISQFQQKCLQSENSVNISSSEVLTNSVSNLMICEYRIDMIHLKTIIMKKKLTWSPLYLTLLTKIVSLPN